MEKKVTMEKKETKKKATTSKQKAKQPLILRYHRLMDAFSKSDDERLFLLDNVEGFIVFVDLDKNTVDIKALDKEISANHDRYYSIPKLTFYETKKIMEEFVNDKVYDIDTKEKLLEIIHSKDARENFLEFIYDHHTEVEKWHQYYQERSRVRIIEWLRNNSFHFVFEEDLDIEQSTIDRLKRSLFLRSSAKEIVTSRKILEAKSKTYYSSEALNPRPKRGRPPKQAMKNDLELQKTTDIYLTVPDPVKPFLYTPDISAASEVTFSAKFNNESALIASLRNHEHNAKESKIDVIFNKLASLCGTVGSDILIPDIASEAPDEAPSTPSSKEVAKTSSKHIEKAGTSAKKKAVVKKKAKSPEKHAAKKKKPATIIKPKKALVKKKTSPKKKPIVAKRSPAKKKK
jgi:hypothetical protein